MPCSDDAQAPFAAALLTSLPAFRRSLPMNVRGRLENLVIPGSSFDRLSVAFACFAQWLCPRGQHRIPNARAVAATTNLWQKAIQGTRRL
jgi:hypothetical protein